MSKREGELKSRFTKELKLQLPEFITLLHASAGAPDRSITGNKFTSMWEFKHGTPSFASPGLQELTCERLDVQGYCRYVIWMDAAIRVPQQSTLIVKPSDIRKRVGWAFDVESWCKGFDMKWLVNQVRKVHGL